MLLTLNALDETPLATRAPVNAANGGVTELSEHTSPESVVLVIIDDPEIREQVSDLLLVEGYQVLIFEHGAAALAFVVSQAIRPDLVLADYHLPGGMNGLETSTRLWEVLHYEPPTIILTEDISSAVLRNITLHKCMRMNKPVRPLKLSSVIMRLLRNRSAIQEPPPRNLPSTICIIDDNETVCAVLRLLLTQHGYLVLVFASAELFLVSREPRGDACLLIDAGLPGMSGLQLIQRLRATGSSFSSIMITGNSEVQLAVESMKAGAVDFLQKPFCDDDLLVSLGRALELSRIKRKRNAGQDDAARHMQDITPRQRQIMNMVLAGHPSKNIAADLGISQRTVENHRASIMKRTGAKSLPALARLAVAAAQNGID